MCDNCPSKTVENKAEWTRETAKPTGERPLPVPGGRGRASDDLRTIYDRCDVSNNRTDNPIGFEEFKDWHQAAIDAAVKEARIDEVATLHDSTIGRLKEVEVYVAHRYKFLEGVLNQPQEKK